MREAEPPMTTGHSMQPLITAKQARQITGGRIPLVPVQYETAVKALGECLVLDDALTWSDKADALAAWAKIYRSDEVSRKAKMLKLHAYRRMGQLAAEINPRKSTAGTGGRGSVPGSGPRSLLLSHGLSVAQADAARILSTLPQRRFDTLLKNPVSPTTARHTLRDTTVWHEFQATAMTLRSRCRNHTPAQVAGVMSVGESASARELVREIVEWLDEFEARLPKVAK